MLIALLLAAAAVPQTAVEAERAFASRAQIAGQWTAFRETAAPDPIMFVPQPTNAQAFFKDFKDPQVAYMWWPAEAYLSCDGKVAVTTGPSVRGRERGYFTTIWVRQPDGGWKWVLDHGDVVEKARPAKETSAVRRASCVRPRLTAIDPPGPWKKAGEGASPDRSLQWVWATYEGGGRSLDVFLRDGDSYKNVLKDRVAPIP